MAPDGSRPWCLPVNANIFTDPRFSVIVNGQCLDIGHIIPPTPFSTGDIQIRIGENVVYTCTNGNLEATFALSDHVIVIGIPGTMGPVTEISCAPC